MIEADTSPNGDGISSHASREKPLPLQEVPVQIAMKKQILDPRRTRPASVIYLRKKRITKGAARHELKKYAEMAIKKDWLQNGNGFYRQRNHRARPIFTVWPFVVKKN